MGSLLMLLAKRKPTPAPVDDPATSAAVVSGGDYAGANGTYPVTGTANGKNSYFLTVDGGDLDVTLYWDGSAWAFINAAEGGIYISFEDVTYPWQVTTWGGSFAPTPTVTQGSS